MVNPKARAIRPNGVPRSANPVPIPAFSSRNRGVSSIPRRSHRPTGSKTAPSRKGRRHAHASISAAENTLFRMAATIELARSPPTTEDWLKLPKKPRFPAGDHSTMNDVALPHSPPADRPCRIRHRTSSTGASTPMLAYSGMTPIPTVPTAIKMIVRTNAELCECSKQACSFIRARKELAGDDAGQETIHAEIVIFEHVADAGCGDC